MFKNAFNDVNDVISQEIHRSYSQKKGFKILESQSGDYAYPMGGDTRNHSKEWWKNFYKTQKEQYEANKKNYELNNLSEQSYIFYSK